MQRLGTHPRVLAVHGKTTDPKGQECIVCGWAPCGSLDTVLAQHPDPSDMSIGVRLELATQVCRGQGSAMASRVPACMRPRTSEWMVDGILFFLPSS